MPKSARTKRKLPNRSIAALAMLQSGYDDLNLIAEAIGISLEEVQAIDSVEDQRIRNLILEGLPEGFVFRVRKPVKCPNCGGRIDLVPCVLCR